MSLRSRNADGQVRKVILCGKLQEKCRTPSREEPFCVEIYRKKCRTQIPRNTFCARLRSRDAHGHLTRAVLCGNLQEICRTEIPGPAFCACVRMSQEPFFVVIYRKNAGPLGEHFD